MSADRANAPKGVHLIITVHGIRTFGGWQARLASLVHEAEPNCEVSHFRFNYFSAIAFWFPPTRWLVVRRFARILERLAAREEVSRLDIVAHSFGTHVVAWGIRRANRIPRIHTLIFCGSVLKSSHFWEDLIPERVGRLINECGHRDNVLVLSQVFVPLTGMAGRVGFVGLLGRNFKNRYYDFGHSGYFVSTGDQQGGCFMRDRWVPLLTREDPVEEHDERGDATPLDGVWITILHWLDPVKMAVFWSLTAAILLIVVGLFADAAVTRERLRSVTEFMLPLATSEEVIQSADVRAINRALAVTLGTSHVLWVDDKPQLTSRERRALGRWGMCFTLVDGTAAAVAQLEAHPGRFSLIISDWNRNEDDNGRDTAIAHARLPEAHRPPLVFYVRFRPDNEENLAAAVALGAIGETSNPFRLLAFSLSVVAGPIAWAAAAERDSVLARTPATITAGLAWVSRRLAGCSTE